MHMGFNYLDGPQDKVKNRALSPSDCLPVSPMYVCALRCIHKSLKVHRISLEKL